MDLGTLVSYLDQYLQIRDFDDRSNNGLQVEGRAEVRRLGFAVDASLDAFRKAADAQVDFLIVHHGLFWSAPLMVTGAHRQRLHTLLANNISLYGAHLPLDAHPEIGNNTEMARLLDLKPTGDFATAHGRPVGLIAEAEVDLSLEEIRCRLGQALSVEAHIWPFRQSARRFGLLTGNAVGAIDEAVALRLDSLICGELAHMVYHTAKEASLGVILGGHYATETLGLKALMRHLAQEYNLDTVWIEAPTGL